MLDIVPFAVLTLVVGAYGLVTLARNARLRSTAIALAGTYMDGGWFRPGKIVGNGYAIAIVRAGKTYRTRVEVPTRDTPGHYVIKSGFFLDGYPNWAHVSVRQTLPERVFVVHIAIPRYRQVGPEHRDAFWRWLTRGSTERRLSPDVLTTTKIKEIAVGDGLVSTSFGGVVTSTHRLRHAVGALRTLAADGGL